MRFNLHHLEREQTRAVSSCACTDYLMRFQRQCPDEPFAALASWAEVRRWLDRVGIWSEAADPLLRLLLVACQQDVERAPHDIALFLFCRRLVWIHWLFRKAEPEPEPRYSQVYWTFLTKLRRIDVQKRPSRLGSKILQDIRHDLYEHYAAQRARARRLALMAATDSRHASQRGGERPMGGDDPLSAAEFAHDRAWAYKQLRTLHRNDVLSRHDFLLLFGCHLCGWTLEEMAARFSQPYQTVKKRRQRLAAHLKKVAPGLSPALPDSPLSSIRRAERKEKRHGEDL